MEVFYCEEKGTLEIYPTKLEDEKILTDFFIDCEKGPDGEPGCFNLFMPKYNEGEGGPATRFLRVISLEAFNRNWDEGKKKENEG